MSRVLIAALSACKVSRLPGKGRCGGQKVQLAVAAADRVDYTFGTLRRFVRRLKALGQACGADLYDHGIDIDCRTPQKPPMVYFHFVYEPGPNPQVAYLASLRINGRNGGEAPRDQWLRFMQTFSHETPKRGDF